MNWVNSGPNPTPDMQSQATFWKSSQLLSAGPAKLSLFWDEKAVDDTDTGTSSQNSIDNGALGIWPRSFSTGFWNVPGIQHNNGCVLSFADGRAESWRWKDKYIATATRFQTTPATDRDAMKVQETVPGAGY